MSAILELSVAFETAFR